jgi:nucleotide-binding universal stress UspA family protein/uncharacterized membrane protein (DUF485 family)
MVRKIMLPTDSSLPALAATIEAMKIAKERNATIVILNVVGSTPSMEAEETAENVALKRCPDIDGMKFARELAKKEGVSYEEVVREGPVSGEIVNAAAEMKVEMIIMGSSAPTGFNQLYLGDVAKIVAKHAKCEVMTINPSPEQGRSALELARSIGRRVKPKTVQSITSTKQFKVGLVLFFIYTTFYGIFIVLGGYGRGIMGTRFLSMNIGMWMGFIVIFMAIIMAVWFNRYAIKMETEQEA